MQTAGVNTLDYPAGPRSHPQTAGHRRPPHGPAGTLRTWARRPAGLPWPPQTAGPGPPSRELDGRMLLAGAGAEVNARD